MAQDLMQEALRSSGSQLAEFLRPTIFSCVAAGLYFSICVGRLKIARGM